MESARRLKGMIAGFVLCAPLGPVGMLCIQRTMDETRTKRIGCCPAFAIMDA
jgi:hypothetical protein